MCAKLYEEVRKSLEQCDVQEDIGHMINLRRTGDKPPGINSVSIHDRSDERLFRV